MNLPLTPRICQSSNVICAKSISTLDITINQSSLLPVPAESQSQTPRNIRSQIFVQSYSYELALTEFSNLSANRNLSTNSWTPFIQFTMLPFFGFSNMSIVHFIL